MAQCTYCKAEVEPRAAETPLCHKCTQARQVSHKASTCRAGVRTILLREVEIAAQKARSASRALMRITADIPSKIPHPDGTQRIRNASRALSIAREKLTAADSRLNDFLIHDIIP